METDKFEQFFVIDHLARDPTDKVVINQIPNVWTIRNEEDEDSVIRDIQQTDFFDLLRDQSNAEHFLIVRMIHMTVDIFPILQCDIHNEVVGNQQYIGRGVSDDDNELEDHMEEDDEYDVTDDDGDTDEEEVSLPRNPYILDEVEEDEGMDEGDDEDDADNAGGGRTNEERLRSI